MTINRMKAILKQKNLKKETIRRYIEIAVVNFWHDDVDLGIAIVDHPNVSEEIISKMTSYSWPAQVFAKIAQQTTSECIAQDIIQILIENMMCWECEEWYEVYHALISNNSVREHTAEIMYLSYPYEDDDSDEDGYAEYDDEDYLDDEEEYDEDYELWGQAWDDAMEK